MRIKTRFEGDQTSSDPRLTGHLEIKATSVVSTENGYGRSKGTFVLRQTYSPGAAFRGEFVAVLEPDGGGEGFLTAESRGRHPLHLLANFNFDQTSPGHLSGEFGTDSQLNSPYSEEDQDPAILTNACFDKKHGHGHGQEAATTEPSDVRRDLLDRFRRTSKRSLFAWRSRRAR